MGDDEMRQLNVPALQDDGYIFLWVTGIYISHTCTHTPFIVSLMLKKKLAVRTHSEKIGTDYWRAGAS